MKKDVKLEDVIYKKVLWITQNVIISRKNFSDQPIDSDIKRYEEIKKLPTGHGKGGTTGCFLYYKYIKSYYRLIAIDLIRQKNRCWFKNNSVNKIR